MEIDNKNNKPVMDWEKEFVDKRMKKMIKIVLSYLNEVSDEDMFPKRVKKQDMEWKFLGEFLFETITKALKANDDRWRKRIKELIEKNKAYDFGIYDYEGIALDLINLLKENK